MLVLVQELELRPDGSPVPPARSLASYSLQELRGLTAEYSASRVSAVHGCLLRNATAV